MSETSKPAPASPERDETLEERAARLERRRVGPEDEVRKSPEGPGAQISPDIEPSGS